jgi:hypothetical protein
MRSPRAQCSPQFASKRCPTAPDSQKTRNRHDRFLEPAEESAELIELHLVSLFGRKITSERNPLLYWVAVHHLSVYLLGPGRTAVVGADATADALNKKHTAAMLAQLIAVAPEDVYRDVVFHDHQARGASFGAPSSLQTLSEHRRGILEDAAASSPELKALFRKRHPEVASA